MEVKRCTAALDPVFGLIEACLESTLMPVGRLNLVPKWTKIMIFGSLEVHVHLQRNVVVRIRINEPVSERPLLS